MTTGPPADWYPDSDVPGQWRYWDGSAWTEHRSGLPAAPRRLPQDRTAATTSPPAPLVGWAKRHKILTSFIAFVAVMWFFGAVSGSADDQPLSGDTQSESSDDEDRGSTSSDNEEPEDSSTNPAQSKTKKQRKTYRVVNVVDGDTIDLGDGETVRLAGIDTPEVGECGYERARNKLAALVLGKRVSLGASDEDRDQYGRLLRYVDVNGTDTGLRLIKGGLAVARYDSRDGYGFHPREPKYTKADRASPAFTCAKPVPLVSQSQEENCAPGYSPCIPPHPPDLNCPDIGHPVRVTGSDPHGLDADGDGTACEWN